MPDMPYPATDSLEVFPRQHPSSIRDIEGLITPEGSLYASNGENYRGMLFGRDALEAADDLLEAEPEVALNVIDSLTRLQGIKYDEASAEEFGKIPHQHMRLYVNGSRIAPHAEAQMRKLGEKWGGDEEGFTYYGSLDATPLYARLVARYGLIHGTEFLKGEVETKTGETINRLEAFRRSVNWICDHLESSELSLLEFKRLSNQHIVVQSWRDSGSSYVHEDGSQVNLNGFIAPLEVQGYAFDALFLGQNFARLSGVNEDEVSRWEGHATATRERVFDAFWLGEDKGFAMAIDRDENWQPRQLKTPSSTQGNLLDTRLFLGIEESERQKYVGSIVRNIHSQDFMTEIGIRCRAISAAHLVPFADYHGSWAVWTKESYDYLKGLRRQGFNKLADDMQIRILNMVNVSGHNYEFLYVNLDGEVDYTPKKYEKGMTTDELIIATNIPEEGQAWTASAILAVKRGLRPKNHLPSSMWSRALEHKLLASIPPAELLQTADDINNKRKTTKSFAIDIDAGIAEDRKWNPDWWR